MLMPGENIPYYGGCKFYFSPDRSTTVVDHNITIEYRCHLCFHPHLL